MRCAIVRWMLAFFIMATALIPTPGFAREDKPTVLHISAGVGLKDALFDIQKAYARKQPGVVLELNFAASGFLRKQIEQGAPVDLFLAPGIQHLQALIDAGHTDARHSCALLGNRLVLIVSKEKRHVIKGFADLSRHAHSISIGLPEMVPAGSYARQALEHQQLWKDLEPRMIYGKSVRQVLAYVDSGNVDAGLVFASDAPLANNATVAALAPESSHQPIVFAMAGMLGSPRSAALQVFMTFLKGGEAAAIFARHGFTPLQGKPYQAVLDK